MKHFLKKILILAVVAGFFTGLFGYGYYAGKPPKTKIKEYKGVFMPNAGIMPFLHLSIFKPGQMLAGGINTVAFGPLYFVKENGEIFKIPGSKHLNILLIQYFHRRNLRVMLVPRLSYNIKDTLFGNPREIPTKIRENKEFLKNLNEEILTWAETAEDLGVELFAPLDQPDEKFGHILTDQWNKEIVPKIKEVYSGNLVFKGDLSLEKIEFNPKIDFRGYDYIGFGLAADEREENAQEKLKKTISLLKNSASESEAKGIFVTGFANNADKKEEESPDVLMGELEKILDGLGERPAGYFILDAPRKLEFKLPKFKIGESFMKYIPKRND